jgi:flagellar hook protein FlgE
LRPIVYDPAMATQALNAALSGLQAQRQAADARAQNVANAATSGYKAVEASFSSFAGPGGTGGGVVARPRLTAAVAGVVVQAAGGASVAVTGSGFLPVRALTDPGGEMLYTRRGDCAPDADGALRNGAGQVLLARAVVGTGPLVPARLDRGSLPAQATTTATYAANLPADAPPGTVQDGGSIAVVDAQGNTRQFAITWFNRTTAGGTLPGLAAGAGNGTAAIPASVAGTVPQWRAVLRAPSNSANGTESLVLDFSFGTTVGTDAGLPTAVAVQSTDPATLSAAVAGGRVTLGYGAPGAAAPPLQQIAVEFRTPAATAGAPSLLGQPGGMTGFGGTSIAVSRASADGAPAGDFVSGGIDADGRIYAAYSNGRRVAQYQVTLANFADPGGLVALGGETFRALPESGDPVLGAGGVAANALEGSNVDLGDEITRTLVAQRAYAASARLVAASDGMLEEMIRLKR